MSDQENKIRISARAVVRDARGHVLLIRHRDGDREFHVLPGGRVEPGETAAEAARREVREETGLAVRVGALRWVREFLPERHAGDPDHRTRMQQLQLYFDAELEQGAEPTAAPAASAPDGTQQAVVWHSPAGLTEIRLLPRGLAAPLAALGSSPAGPSYLGDLG